MSRSYHKSHKYKYSNKPHTGRLRPYKRERFIPIAMPMLARCFEAGKAKVCYATIEDAEAQIDRLGIPLRIYRCGGHHHLTSKL